MSFDRRYRILLDGEPFIESAAGRQFRITFSVSTGFSGYRGTGDIAIYNLSKSSMQALKSGSVLVLQCGYANEDGSDDIGTIYTGRIKNVLRERAGTDVLIRLLMVAETRNHTTVNHTFPVNAKVVDVLRYCANAAGYALDIKAESFSDLPPATAGLTKHGDPVEIISNMAKEYGFQSVVENERIVIVKDWGDRGDGITTISQFDGMEMMPEVSAGGIDVTTRMNSRLAVGRLFKVESDYATFSTANFYYDMSSIVGAEEASAIHYIHKLDHTGDSWGDEWSSQITGIRKR